MSIPSVFRRRVVSALIVSGLAACSAMPQSGPSADTIVDYYHSESRKLGVTLVDLSPKEVSDANAAYNHLPDPVFTTGPAQPTDTIRVGDTLSVVIFQVGPGMFGSVPSAPSSGDSTQPANASSSSVNLPPLVVDRNGMIGIPYGGNLKVVGKTLPQAQRMIAAALRHAIFQPQVVVNIVSTDENTFTILGDVKTPGRNKIAQGERLLDGIAAAGGPGHYDLDEKVDLFRGRRVFTAGLRNIEDTGRNNVLLQAGDRIQVTYDPKTFSVFGATGRIQEIVFDRDRITLAEAVARTSGPSDELADLAGMFLFRFEPRPAGMAAAAGPREVPVIYHLDLSDPQSYFMMRRFEMHDKDLLYIADAQAVQLKKFFGIIGQLFSPLELGAHTAISGAP